MLGRELQSALVSPAAGIEAPGPSVPPPSFAEPTLGRLPLSPTMAVRQPEQRSNRTKWIVGGISALLILAVVGVGSIFALKSLIANRGANANSNASQTVPREKTAPQETKTTENPDSGTSLPQTSQAGLVGKWTGTYGPANNPATLIVKEDKDGKFSGVIEQGEVRVAFNGSVDSKSRRVTIKETQVLSGSGWSLGEDTGEISSDGRKMSGTGKDATGEQFGFSYQWSFTR